MKNVVGNPARGDSFYQRTREIERILERIRNGNNLQIAAPRRIGKTSILYYLLDNKSDNNLYVYVDTEAINDEQDFFKKLLKEILKVDEIRGSNFLQRMFKEGNKFLKRIKSIKPLEGLEFHESDQQVDYKEEVENLLSGLKLEEDKKLVLLIDEFPQTIQNIVEAHKGDTAPAIQFLQSNRDIRLSPEINSKVAFIYTGSIGLNHTVAAIGGSAFINDLNSLEIEPLTGKEAKEFLNQLLELKNLKIDNSEVNYLLGKIEWLIPFHIQLVTQEVLELTIAGDQVTKGIIDNAFEKLIQVRNNNHFEHYYSRLRKHFKNGEFAFADDVLQTIAANGTVEKKYVFDISVKYEVKNWNNTMEVLMYDGYINNIGDKAVFRFNSPVLRMWWERYICK